MTGAIEKGLEEKLTGKQMSLLSNNDTAYLVDIQGPECFCRTLSAMTMSLTSRLGEHEAGTAGILLH